MRDINLYSIQLQDLELFLAVAKYGNFTKAGEKMYMTQSWVSKRINLMETQLGLRLFIRNNRKITLTPAGRVLAQRLEHITEDILDALQEAHTAQKGASGYLRLGFLEWGTNAFIQQLETFMEKNPQISIDLFFQQFHELRSNLETNRLDLIFTMSYDNLSLSKEEYHILPIQSAPMVAYISRKNPLSEKESISVKDMQSENMLMVDQKSSPGYCDCVSRLFMAHNIRPLISQYAHNGREHLGNVLLNKGILIASQYFLGNEFSEQIASVPIEDSETTVTAVWKKQNTNPALLHFLQDITGKDITGFFLK